MAFQPVYVVDGARTPFLKARSGPGPFAAADLAVQAGRALLVRQPFAPDAFDEVMMPLSLALAERCDAVLRIGGPSAGADAEAARFAAAGKPVFRDAAEVPPA